VGVVPPEPLETEQLKLRQGHDTRNILKGSAGLSVQFELIRCVFLLLLLFFWFVGLVCSFFVWVLPENLPKFKNPKSGERMI